MARAKKPVAASETTELNTNLSMLDNMFESLSEEVHYQQIEFFPMNSVTMVDIHNGCIIIDKDGNPSKMDTGIKCGSILHIIGNSGTGKSSLAYQIGAGIISPYVNGNLIIFDAERACTKARVLQLTGMNVDTTNRARITNRKTTSENLLAIIKKITAFKIENKESLMTPHSVTGIMVMPPTVIVVDSLPMLLPDKMEDAEEFTSNMAGSQIAIVNNKIIKQTMDDRISANIILIAVNHITTRINTGTVVTKNNIAGIKPDESVGGGSSWRYLADLYFRLNLVKEFTEADPEKFNGSEVEVQLIKSRAFPSGKRFKIILDKSLGWSDELSNFNFLLERGVITRAGARYKMDGYETSFLASKFREMITSNEVFQNAYNDAMSSAIYEYLPKIHEDQIDQNAQALLPEDIDDTEL